MEVVPVDLNVSSDGHITWSNEGAILINVFILLPMQELALNDSRVLLGTFIDRDSVVSQEE